MTAQRTLVDLLLDGVTDSEALREAAARVENERRRVVALIEKGEYEIAGEGEDG